MTYAGTAQERCLRLMGKKMLVSLAFGPDTATAGAAVDQRSSRGPDGKGSCVFGAAARSILRREAPPGSCPDPPLISHGL